MGKKIDKATGEIRYFIPIDRTYYETNEEVYDAYYKMERRERYLEERSQEFEKSYEKLKDEGFPVASRVRNKEITTEDAAVTGIMIEKLLSKLSVLNDYELWLIQEIYTYGKSDRELEIESGINRSTIGVHRRKILAKLRIELEN